MIVLYNQKRVEVFLAIDLATLFLYYWYMEHDFNHESAAISDRITVLGLVEHIRDHALKSAAVKMDDKDAEVFFQAVAVMSQNFRRKYMKKHFPDIPEELWCLGKAVEMARQRVYEADEGDTEDINEIDAIWQTVWQKITGKDLSSCVACREDKGGYILEDDPGSDIAEPGDGVI